MIEPLPEISLTIKQSNTDEWNSKIRGALDVIAGENTESTRIDRNGFMQTEFSGEVSHRPRPQNSGMDCAPGTIGFQIFALPAVRVIDPAVQSALLSAALDAVEGNLAEQRYRIVVELSPADRIEIPEEARRFIIPAPPQIACKRPQAFLRWSNEAVHRACFAHHGGDLGGHFHEHSNLFLAKHAGLLGLDNEDALKNATIDERHAKERLVRLLAGFLEILEAGMVFHLFGGHRAHLLGNQTGETFVQRHPKIADALRPKSKGGGQHEVGSIGFQQVGRANIGIEPVRNRRNHVHQGFICACTHEPLNAG